MNLAHFPFDIQMCTVEIGEWLNYMCFLLNIILQREFRLHDGRPEVRLEQWTQLSADVT